MTYSDATLGSFPAMKQKKISVLVPFCPVALCSYDVDSHRQHGLRDTAKEQGELDRPIWQSVSYSFLQTAESRDPTQEKRHICILAKSRVAATAKLKVGVWCVSLALLGA